MSRHCQLQWHITGSQNISIVIKTFFSIQRGRQTRARVRRTHRRVATHTQPVRSGSSAALLIRRSAATASAAPAHLGGGQQQSSRELFGTTTEPAGPRDLVQVVPLNPIYPLPKGGRSPSAFPSEVPRVGLLRRRECGAFGSVWFRVGAAGTDFFPPSLECPDSGRQEPACDGGRGHS